MAESRADAAVAPRLCSRMRLQLRWAAGSKWDGVVIDVKTAFLLAPARRRDGSKIAVAVPRLTVDAGLLDPQAYLLVDRALYGLVESPADWSVYRDGTLVFIKQVLPEVHRGATPLAVKEAAASPQRRNPLN